ncbi:tetratricopeptide (TPR) repeat protein [Pseudomonas sp. F-14 TE3623]
MFTRNWPRHVLCLSLSLPLGSALACGPDFPMRLLDNRGQSLAELPEGNFNFEISRLGHAIAGLKNATAATNIPGDGYGDAPDYTGQRSTAEQAGLTPEQQALVKQLRSLTDARQVEEQGTSLPTEHMFYLAGAVAFNAGDHGLAAEYFQKVLALPADQRALRSTWAAYSLGRALFAMSSEAGAGPDLLAQSRKAFEQTRQLSIDGFSDPLELGVASLGEEARVARTAGDWDSAIELYATQNLHGSAVGYSSLKLLMADLMAMPDDQLAVLLKGKAVQQLVTASLISRLGWSFGDQPPSEQKLIKLLQNSTRGSLDNADRLAAMNYQQGDYASAKAFLEQAGDGGLAWWLRAKLALRDGDKSAAAAAYAKAAQAFPQNESWGERRTPDWDYETVQPKCRVDGESAILALQRGDYLQAFDQLYRSQNIYWYDAATVAERVLTLDELKQYVDTQVPAPPPLTQQDRDNYVPLSVAANLRNLLGRRLLREGRYDEAPGYFDNAVLQARAKWYGELRNDAESKWWPTKRAFAYYHAATLARFYGMELLGYEMAPDYATFGGNYSLESPDLKVGPLIAEGEVQRRQATVAQPDERFHYRYIATALASKAADHLPHTSQAFASVLCKASTWGTSLQEQSAFYRRYVEEGPYVVWAGDFGHQCQDPDFQSADKRYVTQVTDAARSVLRPYKKPLQIGGVVAITAAALLLISRRRRKAR